MKLSKFYNHNYLLIIILIVAAVLRLNHVNQPFIDFASWRQGSTAMMADNYYRRNWNIFYPEVSWNGPGLTYQGREFQTITYIAAILYTFLGQHDWIGRGLAALFGVWGIFALYKLVCCVWDRKHALMGAAVMALLPGSIFIERSFLPDPAMVSLTVTGFWLLMVYCKTDRISYLLLATVVSTWGFLTKLPGLIVGIPMLYGSLTILGKRKKLNARQYLLMAITACSILIPVVLYYLWVRHLSLTYPPYHFAGAGNWVWDRGFQNWLQEGYFLSDLYWHLKTWMWTRPFIILFVIGIFSLPPKNRENNDRAPWLFHWWIIALIIYFLIGAEQLNRNSWNLHIINPAAAALAGRGILVGWSFSEKIFRLLSDNISKAQILKANLVATVFFLILIGIRIPNKLHKMYYPTKVELNSRESYELGLALKQVSAAEDLVVTVANDIGEPVAIYYSKRRGWVFPPPWKDVVWWELLEENDDYLIGLFEKLRKESADWFGIVAEHREELWENRTKFMQHVVSTCELVRKTDDFTIYRIKSGEEISKAFQQ